LILGYHFKIKDELIIVCTVIAIGLSVAVYLYRLDSLFLIYYNDSISHLVRSRELVDSLRPGLQQLGTAWLPLPHIMLLPFSLVDILFRTGFAGLMVGLPSLAISSVFLYKIIRRQTGITYISIAGALLYALNPNMLYLALTAMTEIPFMLFFIISAYYFQRYTLDKTFNFRHASHDLERNSSDWVYSYKLYHLIKCALFISFATLCRYEGWIIPIFFVPYTIITAMRARGDLTASTNLRNSENFKRHKAYKVYLVLVPFLSFSGIVFWMGYNAYFYNDPLEFQNAQFWSAAWFAKQLGSANTLFLNPLNVVSQYTLTSLWMYGPILLIGALIGFVLDIFWQKQRLKRLISRAPLYIFLLLPALVVPLSLLFGNAELNTRHEWFNSRYLVLLSPIAILLFSVFGANLYHKFKLKSFIIYAVIGVVFLSQFVISFVTVVTFADAQNNKSDGSRPFVPEMAQILKSKYTSGKVLIITGSAQKNYIMQAVGIPLKNFEKVFDADIRKASFKEPWLDANYIVISKKPDASAKNASKYWLDRQYVLDQYYDVVYENKYYELLIRK
jgi:hypothetical protein